MKSVYLSGPIAGCSFDGASNWRSWCALQLLAYGIHSLTPMRGKDFLRQVDVIEDEMPDLSPTGWRDAIRQDAGIVGRDRMDTTKADFLLVNLLGATRTSIGTMVELGWADLARVPVVLVMEKSGNIHEHPFVLRQLATYRVDNLPDAINILAHALAGQ